MLKMKGYPLQEPLRCSMTNLTVGEICGFSRHPGVPPNSGHMGERKGTVFQAKKYLGEMERWVAVMGVGGLDTVKQKKQTKTERALSKEHEKVQPV